MLKKFYPLFSISNTIIDNKNKKYFILIKNVFLHLFPSMRFSRLSFKTYFGLKINKNVCTLFYTSNENKFNF